MTDQLHFHFSLSCIGEGNGNPLQCSCLDNPRDEGAWWAAVYGVTQSQTRLERAKGKMELEAQRKDGERQEEEEVTEEPNRFTKQNMAEHGKGVFFEEALSVLEAGNLNTEWFTTAPAATQNVVSATMSSTARKKELLDRHHWIVFFQRVVVVFCCSVTKSCPTLCDTMDCSTPGFPVLHHLPELAQTHVH